MLSPNLTKLLTAQIARELYASGSYLQASSLAYAQGLVALSAWLRKNAQEEREHCDGIVAYLDKRGADVRIPLVNQPTIAAEPAAMAAAILQLEESVTAALTEIQIAAEAERDRQTYSFMSGYIAEQTEGEDSARKLGRFVAMSGDGATLDQQVKMGFGE